MKYFIDTEFIEGFHKPLFGKRRHFIDLISIGIIAEDGREFYAISNEFNPKDADDWVRENVIAGLPQKNVSMQDSPRMKEESMLYKPNKQIAEEIIAFVNNEPIEVRGGANVSILTEKSKKIMEQGYTEPEFYGYYADYDWVLLCSLFGRMIDLPKGFTMFCIDLKQSLDEVAVSFFEAVHPGKSNLDERLLSIKVHPDYPKQENEHNALADAKWNQKLYKFLNTL